jgi:hypothetical protein
MYRVSSRSFLGLVIAATIGMLQGAALAAQEAVVAEKTVPPSILTVWCVDWTVTCTDFDGNRTTTSGRSTGGAPGSPNDVEIVAQSDAENHFALCCDGAFPVEMTFSDAYVCIPDPEPVAPGTSAPSPCAKGSVAHGEWSVEYKCTDRKGGYLKKVASGRTYHEALCKARQFVCRSINKPWHGGACRCCTRVIQRPVCNPCCGAGTPR